ncbi:OB-fold-containig protein [Tropicibacter oceani]|uniref:DUF1449 family protein n=1 Tax=Tropicibacter oceani TaxID=3058420 RepID=A0ABY8QJZ3_9RHOB|nr:OB-fold-containig protein [Tropicibacter oceani]WGW04326.1 DUF1449 family protein [Tropicibacter oceani]
MFDPFLTGPFVPFTIALALLFALLALELVFAILGGTLLGMGGEGLDGPDLDMDAPDLGDLDIDLDLDGLDIDTADLELPGFADTDLDVDGQLPDAANGMGGVAAWLGFGRMPALIWLGAVFFAFGAGGIAVQSIAVSVLGSALPATLVTVPVLVLAFGFARKFGAIFARLLPKTETQSLSERHLGRRPGIITQGTAARGRPAEVRVTDRYGNTHYLRAEPLRDDIAIPQGTEVLVLRHRQTKGYLLVPLTL